MINCSSSDWVATLSALYWQAWVQAQPGPQSKSKKETQGAVIIILYLAFFLFTYHIFSIQYPMHDCKCILTNERPACTCSNPCCFFVLLSTFFAADSFYSYQKQSFLYPHLLIAGQRSARSPEPGVSHELARLTIWCNAEVKHEEGTVYLSMH